MFFALIKKLINRLRRFLGITDPHLAPINLIPLINPSALLPDDQLVRLGTEYGGWLIPKSIALGQDSVCYLAGAGEDISFDCALAMTYKCQVRILDPTPRAIAHFQLLSGAVDASKPFLINGIPGNTYNIDKYTFSRIRFIPVGIAGANETMRFYYPKNEEHVSCSTVNLQKTDRWFEARCFQLSSIMRDQNDQKIDLLKMDIEGGEYAVISDLVSSGPLPNILLIEFDEAHSPMDDRAIERIALHISMLEKVGMKCIAIDGANLSFIRD